MDDLLLTPFVRSIATAVVAGVLLAGGEYVIAAVLTAIAIAVFALDLRRYRSGRPPLI